MLMSLVTCQIHEVLLLYTRFRDFSTLLKIQDFFFFTLDTIIITSSIFLECNENFILLYFSRYFRIIRRNCRNVRDISG